MKKIVLTSITLITILTSCTSIKHIGKLNMISNRNIDSNGDYIVLSTYAGGSSKELRKSRALTLEDAVDKTVRKVPGGDYLMNAKIYIVKHGKKIYLACEGDVWGKKGETAYRGFKIGDKVILDGLVNTTAKIKSFKDDKTCFIERINGVIEEVKYDRISKAE